MDIAVFRREITRAMQSLCCRVVISLAQRQQAPVGPTSRFACCQLRKLRKLAVGLHVVTDLKCCESDIKAANDLVVFGG